MAVIAVIGAGSYGRSPDYLLPIMVGSVWWEPSGRRDHFGRHKRGFITAEVYIRPRAAIFPFGTCPRARGLNYRPGRQFAGCTLGCRCDWCRLVRQTILGDQGLETGRTVTWCGCGCQPVASRGREKVTVQRLVAVDCR
jgi:hypothetical protein